MVKNLVIYNKDEEKQKGALLSFATIFLILISDGKHCFNLIVSLFKIRDQFWPFFCELSAISSQVNPCVKSNQLVVHLNLAEESKASRQTISNFDFDAAFASLYLLTLLAKFN